MTDPIGRAVLETCREEIERLSGAMADPDREVREKYARANEAFERVEENLAGLMQCKEAIRATAGIAASSQALCQAHRLPAAVRNALAAIDREAQMIRPRRDRYAQILRACVEEANASRPDPDSSARAFKDAVEAIERVLPREGRTHGLLANMKRSCAALWGWWPTLAARS